MMVILLFTPCAKDKIVFADLIFLFLDFRYKKANSIPMYKINFFKLCNFSFYSTLFENSMELLILFLINFERH